MKNDEKDINEKKNVNFDADVSSIKKSLGIEGESDTASEALSLTSGQVDIEEYLENTVEGESVEERQDAKKKVREKIFLTAGIGKNVIRKSVERVLHESMMPYSEHVILDRALPRVEDGLKPVQRRILFTLLELGITPDKPYRKSARIVGDCLGKYHPHGDSSVYDAMVRLAQPFNMNATLVDGHGNFGSIDGDSAAAMRYTEARMAPLALEMLRDLDKDTVEWNFNFDDTLREPTTLPARFPNLLVNGASGIAVGLATNIPPHNIEEVISGVIAFIDNRNITLDEMMKIIKAPDFPTGGFIFPGEDLRNAYENGRGKILLRAKLHIEKGENDKRNIVITELPYQVNKAKLLTRILELRDQKKDLLSGIAEICDESDRNGMRAVIRIKKDVDPAPIIELLYKHTDLQTSFGINIVAIADGRPQQMGLLDIIAYYTDYQREVILRRSKFELEEAKERAHIVEGLVVAVENIDEVIKIIKASENTAEAKVNLRNRFALSERQAQAILDMRLARLTSLEIVKLKDELAELKRIITRLSAIVSSKKLQFDLIKEELMDIRKRFKTGRKSNILDSIECLVPDAPEAVLGSVESVVVSISKAKTIKSMTQKHCASANTEFSEKSNEYDTYTILTGTSTDKKVIAFSNLGNAFRIDPSTIPDGKWRDRGTPFSSFENEAEVGEYPVAILEIPEDFSGELLFFSKSGMVKRSAWSEYNLQKSYFQAVKFRDGDELFFVCQNLEDSNMLFVTKLGMVLHAEKSDVPLQGRISGGVKGINISDGDELILATLCRKEDGIALVSDSAFAKRLLVSEIEPLARYRKGVKIFDLRGDNGKNLLFAGIIKNDGQIFDCIIESKDGVLSAYSTEIFDRQNRTGRGKSLVKSKKGENLVAVWKYLSQISFG